jgi:DNA-binding NarL/FixJ family response regulator
MPLKIFVLEDQKLFRDLVVQTLQSSLGATIVGAYGTVGEVMENLATAATADVGILDVRLGTTESFELLPALREGAPATRLMWVTSVQEDALLHRALAANLPGFIHKDDTTDELVTAVQRVADGGTFVSPSVRKMRERLFSQPELFAKILSTREQEVLRTIGRGFTNEETAAVLGLSAQTVKAHRRNIMSRLDLHSAAELQSYAVRHGFVAPQSLR